jgi:hypothetical protein
MNINEIKIDKIISENISEVIQYGELIPSTKVLEKVVQAIGDASFFYDAINGDEQFANLVIKGDLDAAKNRADQLMQRSARYYLWKREHIAWEVYETQMMPVEE